MIRSRRWSRKAVTYSMFHQEWWSMPRRFFVHGRGRNTCGDQHAYTNVVLGGRLLRSGMDLNNQVLTMQSNHMLDAIVPLPARAHWEPSIGSDPEVCSVPQGKYCLLAWWGLWEFLPATTNSHTGRFAIRTQRPAGENPGARSPQVSIPAVDLTSKCRSVSPSSVLRR